MRKELQNHGNGLIRLFSWHCVRKERFSAVIVSHMGNCYLQAWKSKAHLFAHTAFRQITQSLTDQRVLTRNTSRIARCVAVQTTSALRLTQICKMRALSQNSRRRSLLSERVVFQVPGNGKHEVVDHVAVLQIDNSFVKIVYA